MDEMCCLGLSCLTMAGCFTEMQMVYSTALVHIDPLRCSNVSVKPLFTIGIEVWLIPVSVVWSCALWIAVEVLLPFFTVLQKNVQE